MISRVQEGGYKLTNVIYNDYIDLYMEASLVDDVSDYIIVEYSDAICAEKSFSPLYDVAIEFTKDSTFICDLVEEPVKMSKYVNICQSIKHDDDKKTIEYFSQNNKITIICDDRSIISHHKELVPNHTLALHTHKEVYNHKGNIVLKCDDEIVTISGNSSNVMNNRKLADKICNIERMINNVHFKFVGDDNWYIAFGKKLIKLEDEPIDLLSLVTIKSQSRVKSARKV
jgi:hypothetical protein